MAGESKLAGVQPGDRLLLKKNHPCGSREWEVLRIGADFRIRCAGCKAQVMLPRTKLEKSTVKTLKTP